MEFFIAVMLVIGLIAIFFIVRERVNTRREARQRQARDNPYWLTPIGIEPRPGPLSRAASPPFNLTIRAEIGRSRPPRVHTAPPPVPIAIPKCDDDRPASEAQRGAVRTLLRWEPPADLTSMQAHLLLSARDFADPVLRSLESDGYKAGPHVRSHAINFLLAEADERHLLSEWSRKRDTNATPRPRRNHPLFQRLRSHLYGLKRDG